MRWLGALVSFAAILAGICLGSGSAAFVDIPSILFVILGGGGMVVAAHGVSAVVLVTRTVLSRIAPEEIEDARSVFQTGIRAFTAAGWLGVIIGVVQMLTHLDDPSQVGPATAVALLTAFYCHVFAYMVCMPLERSLSCKNIARLYG